MPSVFVSATSRDMKSYRAVVAEWARSRGYVVVVQDEFPVHSDYGTIVQMLRDKLAPCDAVVHLAGLFYGFEPTNRPDGEQRRSYTQLEYELGKELRRQVFRFIAREDYPLDQPILQSDEHAELQRKHRQRLTQGCEPFSATSRTTGNELYYEFSNPDELRKLLGAVVIRGSMAKPSNLPYPSMGTLFKGRDEFLNQLREVLVKKPTHIAAVTAQQAIHGLGGVGKTRTAVEYAWKHAHEYTALLFITADSPSNLQRSLAALCGALVLNLPEQDARKQPVQFAAAVRWLREHVGWFLIVDNVDTPEAAAALELLLQDLSGGHVVITSRLAHWSRGVEALALDVLSEDAATDFLLERTADQRRAAPTDAADARALARELDCLALALEQAGAFIVKHCTRLADYHQRWKSMEPKVLKWFDKRAMKYPRSVAVTWQTSIKRMSKDGRRLLNVLCWLSPDPIPRDLAEKITTQEGEPSIDVETGLADLAAYSLARWNDSADAITIHRLVEEMTRYRLLEADRSGWLQRALRMMDDFVPVEPPANDVRSWPTIYVPCEKHLAAIVQRADQRKITAPTTRLMNALAGYLYTRCQYAEAEPLMRRALAIDEQSYGDQHPNVAAALNNLAQLLNATNRLAEAEPLMQRMVGIFVRFQILTGHPHPNLQAAIANHCALLEELGRSPAEIEQAFAEIGQEARASVAAAGGHA